MTIETAGVPSQLLADYAAVPIAFEVTSVLSALKGTERPFELTASSVDPPYVKDYDAIGDRPLDWAARFDTSQWVLFLARSDGRSLGGATLALGTSELHTLEDRSDLAVLWDIRVTPAARGRGIGRALLGAAEALARARGYRELKVETQNVNVPACRFYAALGFQLRAVREHAYPACPGETQLLWYKALHDSMPAAGSSMDYSLEATYYRTALLLGVVRGEIVRRWAERVIEHDPEPPPAFFDVVSVQPADLSALRHALWPLVREPDPPAVLEAIFGLLYEDLSSGRRSFTDTITILRQVRSMLRLPPPMYADLNAALVASAAESTDKNAVARWLRPFAQSGVAQDHHRIDAAGRARREIGRDEGD
jgi:ribosomal protein S18 acetylase RimI-like enzyme